VAALEFRAAALARTLTRPDCRHRQPSVAARSPARHHPPPPPHPAAAAAAADVSSISRRLHAPVAIADVESGW